VHRNGFGDVGYVVGVERGVRPEPLSEVLANVLITLLDCLSAREDSRQGHKHGIFGEQGSPSGRVVLTPSLNRFSSQSLESVRGSHHWATVVFVGQGPAR